jgi:hypothetical protein
LFAGILYQRDIVHDVNWLKSTEGKLMNVLLSLNVKSIDPEPRLLCDVVIGQMFAFAVPVMYDAGFETWLVITFVVASTSPLSIEFIPDLQVAFC